ncbi:MAG: hypothetical protein HOO86_09055 [Bacteroidales bacterium]|nr:hypothetical protein [Bacteroidales bacterium]
MLLIKRLTAGLINLVFFTASILIIFPVLNYFSIELEHKYFLLLVFIITYFLPIFLFSSSVGYKILHIGINYPKRLALKYFIYYFILSGLIGKYILLFEGFTNLSFGHINSLSLLLIPIIIVSLLSIILFIFSLGRFNLIDFILNLTYSEKNYKRNSILILTLWLFTTYVTLFTAIIGQKFLITDYFNKIEQNNLYYIFTNYYPKEIFDEYTYFQTEKINSNNSIITFSDSESFFEDKFLVQKSIYALVNKETFDNELKRLQLAFQLIIHSNINDAFNRESRNVDQTRILMIYNEPHTYFSKKIYVFRYYYDNLNPKHSIYGGVQLDSLVSYYKSQIDYPEKAFTTALINTLGITEDSLNKIIDSTDAIELSDENLEVLHRKLNFAMRKSNEIPLILVPFSDVEPSIWLNVNSRQSNTYHIELTESFYMEEMFYEAIYWRDYNYYKNHYTQQ